MKEITLTIPDNLYNELVELKERDSDTVAKVAQDILYDVIFEDELGEAWEKFANLDMLFENIPVLSTALQDFSDVLVICTDVGTLTRDEAHQALLKCIELLENYHKHNNPTNLDYVVNYLKSIYEAHKEELLVEAKRLAALPNEEE